MLAARPSVPPVDADQRSDADLVRQCLARDEGAVRELTRRHNQRLYRMARTIVRDPADAEDAVQEAYLKAFSGLDRFRGESAFSTWITRIVINEALARVRSRRPTVEWNADSESRLLPRVSVARVPGGRDPEAAVARRELRALLERLIDDLPEPFRLVFVARFVEGLTLEETGQLLGLRTETVKTRAHRARRRLRAELRRQLGGSVADVFRFDGLRCRCLTEAVLTRLGIRRSPPPGNLSRPVTSNLNREP